MIHRSLPTGPIHLAEETTQNWFVASGNQQGLPPQVVLHIGTVSVAVFPARSLSPVRLGGRGAVMSATLDGVKKMKVKAEPSAEERVAEELVRRAREQGLSLTGPDGLLKQLTKRVYAGG